MEVRLPRLASTNPDSVLKRVKAKENPGQTTSVPAVENVHSGGVVFFKYSVDLDVCSASA
jgi:hypothetical protein